ncbi:unnamed protein product [Withania somnifera]
MADIAKLVDVLSSGDDLSRRLRTDSSLNLGFQKLCSILQQAVEPTADVGDKLGLQLWDQSQIQAVASLALALVNSTRSLSVERVEPVIVAAIHLSVEFSLCYLEKCICNSDDSMLQSYIPQLLEIALVHETDKELDLSQPCSSNVIMDMLPIAVTEASVTKWKEDDTRCMLQGGRCSKEEKTTNSLLMTLESEWMHPDNVDTDTIGQPVPYDTNSLIDLSKHWALVHLECVHRLITVCKNLLRLPVPFDEKFPFPTPRKRLSFCVKVFKLLGSLTKNGSYAHFDPKLFESVASFTEVLLTWFRLGFDFVTGNPAVESGFEGQVMLLLEAFIQLVQTIFCNTYVFQNIQACIAAAILDHLDPNLWKYSKSVAANLKPPLPFCPHVVAYVLKLILDVRNRTYQLFDYKGIDGEDASARQLVEPPLCQVHSAKVNLLKKYSAEELLTIIFSPSVQWVDNLMQLLLFLHSEGVKLNPKLERSCSGVSKTPLHPTLFGDLFPRVVVRRDLVDGCDQPAVAPSSNISNLPIQAAIELLSFLNDCIFHVNGPADGIALNEQMKVSHRHLAEIFLDPFHNLLKRHALSDLVVESLVEKILVIENGAFAYNDLTLGLLAHACCVTKIYNIFADFVCEKVETICSKFPNPKEFPEYTIVMFGAINFRLIVMLRHMVFYPRVCPSSLLLKFGTKPRQAASSRLRTRVGGGHTSSWLSILFEGMSSIDITPLPPSACRDDPTIACTGLSWEGKKHEKVEDPILERYIFVLCWDLPVLKSTSNISHLWLTTNHFVGEMGKINCENFFVVLLDLIHRLHDLHVSEDVRELGWDFLRAGSWLSLSLSLLTAGTTDTQTSRDGKFFAFTEGVISTLVGANQVEQFIESFLIATIDSDCLLANQLSPQCHLCALVLTNATRDELLEKMGHSKVVWESLLHGFPCLLQPPSEILLSSILNVAGVVNCIDGLMKILELVRRIKCDRIFEDLHGKCYGGLDYSSLFILKHMEEFLRCVNERDGGDTRDIYKVLVLKVIDIVDSLKREPSKIGVLKSFLSLKDVSKQIKDLYGSQRGDLLVLVDALDKCNSSRSIPGIVCSCQREVAKKFLHMDTVYLSKWIETGLLGCDASGVASEKGASVTLRESTMNFISCLSSPSSTSFLLFDFLVAKCYFNFLVHLSGGESLIKKLTARQYSWREGRLVMRICLRLKYLFGFLASVLSNCCSAKSATERSFVKSIPNGSSGMGSAPTRSVSSGKNADALVLSTGQGGSASIECDATSLMKMRMMKHPMVRTKHWYFCYTCDLTVSKGHCSVCAKVCHRGHRVVYSRSIRFFSGASNFRSFLPFTKNGDQLHDSDSDIDEDVLVETKLHQDVYSKGPSRWDAYLINELDLESCVVRLSLDSNLSAERKISTGNEKVVRNGVDLLQLKKAYRSGSLDLKIKVDYSNAKELKSHLASSFLVKSLLCVSSRGRLLCWRSGQALVAPVTADKTNVKPLSRNVVRFEIVDLIFNPLVENYLAVVSDRLAIVLALQDAYIKHVDRIPGSQVRLMVVTNKFVKIYDLSFDNISPVHYFTLPNDVIMDVALIMASRALYGLELSTKGNVGAKPLKEILQIEGKERHAKGSSLYFFDGTTLVGRVNPDATSLIEVSSIVENETDGKLRPVDCTDGEIYLFELKCLACAISFGEHEVLVQNLRHSVGSTSPIVGVLAYNPLLKDKIHCLVLHEDGSLRIYSHVPTGVDSGFRSSTIRLMEAQNRSFRLIFLREFVCITQDVKASSDAKRNGDYEITVSNSNPDLVMVGLRLHVGNTSANHIPSEITVFQRGIKLDEEMRSWYDVPFIVAESLLADEEFTITVGPTFSISALPRIDSLEIYGRAKDEFGWKEKMDAVLDMEARVLGCNSWSAVSRRKYHATESASLQEQVVAAGLKLLSRIYSFCKPQGCSKVEEVKGELSKLKCKPLLETVFESDREPLLQAAANHVLQAVFPRREMYYQVKDAIRLAGVVKSTTILSSKLGMDGTAAGWIVEEFTAQMRVVSKIALHRRSNLASFLEMNGSEVVDGLMQVLWGILDIEQPDTQTLNNIVVSSVELVYCYAECLALHGKDGGRSSVAPAVSLFKKLLFSTNEAVQASSSLAISSRFLQVPFPKQTMIGIDDVENPSTVPSRVGASAGASGSTQVMVEEDSITSSVQYCCDGCSTVPILRQRWLCTVCPDFDLCEACYEVLDADHLPPPHSRDHPMTAIPIEVETFGGEGGEIHFTTDDLSDSGLLTVASDVGVQSSAPSIHELEPNESEEFSASILDPVTISASKRAVNSLLLSELLEQLQGWMETTSGTGAIPVMQLFYRLSSAVGGPFADSSEPESIGLENLIKWFLDEINLNKPFISRSRTPFGEVIILVFMFFTLMLRNWHQPGTDGSATKSGSATEAHDKTSLHSSNPTCVTASSTLDGQKKIDFISHLLRACGYLRQQAFVNYLMNILQDLSQVFKVPSANTDLSSGLNTTSGCGALLTIRREVPAGNFSPFFSDSYAKSHRADIFVDYHRLLLENTFRLLYSLIRPEKHDKAGEKEKLYKMPSGKDLKLDGYQDVLCSYINNPNTSYVRRYARRLFLHLCGSKTHYYSVRDSWQFSTEVKKLYKHINKSGGFQSSISYERSMKVVRCLTTMAEVAAARPRNWQKYCLRHGDVLRFLLNGIFYFGEECVIQTLKLLNLAFYTGKDGTTRSQAPQSKKKKKGEESDSGVEKALLDMEAVVEVFSGKGDVLRQFIDCFLLEWNSSSVRSESKSVLLGVWYHGNLAFKETLLTVLLQRVNCLPMYGQNIIEFTELVTFLLGKVPDHGAKLQSAEVVDKCLTTNVISCIFDTLHSQNELLANHPNSRIYNTLSGLVEFDGYYLESEPCVACSSPEVPCSRMKLESLKSETKFTDNRIIVKCTGSYTIQSVAMNVHDARKSKSVKVLNLYYNNRPVADLSELKNNWSLWKRAKGCHLAFNQTKLKVDFAIPITACNFMIELDSFYENLQALSLEPLQCPSCSRAVTDKHGICNNCHENAYQCRQCRNINYENLDSFLCNECGYSKYGRFEFNFMAKPNFSFDSMENDVDMKKGLAVIEAEIQKPLLKIVSSVGENEMDSQQKDSVQQMMVSLPGPSCKINRKIALLGVLYGEKCKAAFDSVSKSVQTLQGLRQVLMNYLHQKQSDANPASRFVVSRVPNSCYGCASTFVTQCLEILQVLSKHPASKKQLVVAGILSELFENNIHQGPKTARVQARGALCAFSEGDINAVAELNSLIQKKVMYCLEHHRSMDIALATREELSLLSDVCSLSDEFWESRLRVVFQLLFESIKVGAKHPAISEHVILPCLRIISQACTPPKPDVVEKEQGAAKSSHVTQVKDDSSNVSGSNSLVSGSRSMSGSSEKSWNGSQKAEDIQLLSYSEWEKGASYLDFVRRKYKVSPAGKSGQRSRLQRYEYLALKYLLSWKRRASKTARNEISSFELGSWVTELILSTCSQSIRSEMCMLISLLCGKSSSRRFRLLNLLMSLLSATLSAGENAAEYFKLLFKMIDTEDVRLFLTVRGCLETICKLITQELVNVEKLERSLHVDISRGFILHKLIELLGKFLEVPNIRSRFMRKHLLPEVLEALIVIRGLVVQKTKLINDCNRLLKDLLDSLLLESNENKCQFIQACISGLQIHRNDNRGRTSLFILEQLCNLISPSKPEPVYLLILNKAHTQEEFIRGSMTKNPYSSAEIGPLMHDVKNKICQQLDLLGLIEVDYGMELLVAGNIISLDLSIAQVFALVWKKSNSQSASVVSSATSLSSGAAVSVRDCPPMTVTYRLQGLDGEATEPMIKEIDEHREETQDPEVEFAIAGAVRDCGGLEILLGMVQRLEDDFKSNREQLVAVLNLLMLCCKISENRKALLKLGAVGLLLETARRAFFVDAMEPAEEANESDNISITSGVDVVSSDEAGAGEQAKKIVLLFLERLSHPSGLRKSHKQQRNTEMNWVEFDRLQKLYADNMKDETIAQQDSKQKYTLENFVRVSESLKTSSCGERLKDIILEKGITGAAVSPLKESFAFTGHAGFKSTMEWASGLKLSSIPLILSMLRGLSMGHLATQKCINEGGILPLLHALEGVSGENEIGATAENLLDTMSDKEGKGDGFLAQEVHQLRHATRDEMRRRALRKRTELLQGLGMRQELSSDGGERIVVARPVLEGLEDVEDEEEEGLACMVCREGYRLRPSYLLGVYTYSKQVILGVGSSGNARGDCVYTTVSHFNIIHFQCHQEAKRADVALKNPKKEWDGAALRNNETLCNNLFPLRDYLNALGRADGSRLRLLAYDIVLMLARFATGASFSADCRGGGKESNARFLPFMMQMDRHLLDHDSSQRHIMVKPISTYLSSPASESRASTTAGSQTSAGTEETVQFMMLWLQNRSSFLQRGIHHAYIQRTHGRPMPRSSPNLSGALKTESGSTSTSGSEAGGSVELFSTIQPMLVYTGLIEQLQRFFKVKKSSTATTLRTQGTSKNLEDDDSRKLEGWEVVMKERLLNVKEMANFSSELLSWLNDMTSATHFQEAFDVLGVLSDVLSGFSRCEDYVHAAISGGKS